MSDFQGTSVAQQHVSDIIPLSSEIYAYYGQVEQVFFNPDPDKYKRLVVVTNLSATTGRTHMRPQDLAERDFADGDVTIDPVNTVTETAHGYLNGDGPFQLTATVTLPAGLALATDYYIEVIDANTIAFHLTKATVGWDDKGDPTAFTADIGHHVDVTDRVPITAAASGGTHTIGGFTATGYNALPGASITDGHGSIQFSGPSVGGMRIFAAPRVMTIEGTAATASLTFWWAP